MPRSFAIVTTSMGRLEQLKLSLPRMVGNASEVIVVDFSCPDGTAAYVRANFPTVRVVSVEGEDHFSNWHARNAGAAAATSDMLIFCDADTIMADGAACWLDENLPARAIGVFDSASSARFNSSKNVLALNQLKGFQVVPAAAFAQVGGYDRVLQGYAAGGDTDLMDRLIRLGLKRFPLGANIIESVIEHDNAERRKNHLDPVPTSYCAGLLYRAVKQRMLGLSRRAELPLKTRQTLYALARKAARRLGPDQDRIAMSVAVDPRPLLMPRQLGFEKGTLTVSILVEIAMQGRIDAIPD